jgi:hypothetical protein
MEKYTCRRAIAAGALMVMGGLGLAACGSDHENYAGQGNEYVVKGMIHDIESDDTIHIDQDALKVVSSSGKATKWFAEHKGQDPFSDKFNFDPDYNHKTGGAWSTCEHNVRVGKAYDVEGREIDPSKLHPGDYVEIDGSIRDSDITKSAYKSTYCGHDPKSVFDIVRVIHGPES